MRINPVRNAFPMSKADRKPSVRLAGTHAEYAIETFGKKSYTQQYAVNYSIPR
jgi:hypothetical protein